MPKPAPESQNRHLSREQVREIDRIAIEAYKIPSLILMENAGLNAARLIAELVAPAKPIVIICGRGNNGGDGFVIARHLSNWNRVVQVIYIGNEQKPPKSADCAINKTIVEKLGLDLIDCPRAEDLRQVLSQTTAEAVLVDAFLGTGLSQKLRDDAEAIVRVLNEQTQQIIAIDCPSGFDCNRGTALGACVKASHTITMAALKLGFLEPQSKKFTGQIQLVEIGVPQQILEKFPSPRAENEEVKSTKL